MNAQIMLLQLEDFGVPQPWNTQIPHGDIVQVKIIRKAFIIFMKMNHILFFHNV